MKTYVTFGQDHVHRVDNKTIDCNCVAVVNGDRAEVERLFGRKFCFTYTEDQYRSGQIGMEYYPRGAIELFPQTDTSVAPEHPDAMIDKVQN